MKFITASSFNIKPGEDISEKLVDLITDLSKTDDEKTVSFESGTYYINSDKCKKYMLYITNTVGDKEFADGEQPHINAVAFYFGDISNLIFDGNGSIFVIDGKTTSIAVENCKNITLKSLEIRYEKPDMHELKVVSKSAFSVDFEVDSDTQYKVENGMLIFYGKDYYRAADKKATAATWIGLVREDTPQTIKRVLHPLFSAISVTDLGSRKIRVKFLNTTRFKKGDCFYIYDVRRQFAGIFINESQNVTLKNIKQRFNYSLALVAQCSKDIFVDAVDFSPENGSVRKMASVADFVQLCMCRGNIVIENSNFDGAGDDCLNVHGIHFIIKNINGNEITVRFMHPQTHAFNPLKVGDTIAFINPNTLLEEENAIIRESRLVNEYEIKLTLDDASKAKINYAIEDIDACPNLDFINNTMTKIITRGILITTRGKVNITGNRFVSNSMSGILLSDDAKNWYESGMCKDVTINNNTFDYCGETPILIKPENSEFSGAVHSNIKIIDNVFKKYNGCCIDAKATDNITVSGNEFMCGEKIKTVDCNNVVINK